MIGIAVPVLLSVLCALVALYMYSLFRQEKANQRERPISDRELYALGQAEDRANKRAKSSALATLLHEAGVETSPVVWLAGFAGMSFVAFACVVVASSNVLVGVLAGLVVAGGIGARVLVLRKRRRMLLDRQIVRILPQVSASVRSSLTIERALRVAVAHVDDPLREELSRVLAATTYGTTLSVALDGLAKRTGSPVAQALAAALRIQQRFGGPIAPVLDLIAHHGSARLKASQELKTELAGTRLAKWFVAGSLPVIFLIMFATNSDFAQFYIHEPLGWAVLGLAAVSEAFGLIACHRITSCKGVEA